MTRPAAQVQAPGRYFHPYAPSRARIPSWAPHVFSSRHRTAQDSYACHFVSHLSKESQLKGAPVLAQKASGAINWASMKLPSDRVPYPDGERNGERQVSVLGRPRAFQATLGRLSPPPHRMFPLLWGPASNGQSRTPNSHTLSNPTSAKRSLIFRSPKVLGTLLSLCESSHGLTKGVPICAMVVLRSHDMCGADNLFWAFKQLLPAAISLGKEPTTLVAAQTDCPT